MCPQFFLGTSLILDGSALEMHYRDDQVRRRRNRGPIPQTTLQFLRCRHRVGVQELRTGGSRRCGLSSAEFTILTV
jgi:hypothetical protein